MERTTVATNDEVDLIIDAWARERPDIDFAPLDVFSRLRRLSRRLDRIRSEAFAHAGLEIWEFDVLSALRRAGDPFQLSPKHLVTATMVTSGTMTNRLDRLVERGLVERRGDPSDGRGVLVRVTEDGIARVDAAMLSLVDAESARLHSLSPAQQAQLADLLRLVGDEFS
ncbi:MarR family winged helix-turn-helix transcriptional regulator [Frigoribacterium sp. VKM Ac-2836]|uniref:MarR family winged helix-turn-helix transcriptional regulator n=1 Tax=Frigoribacterium sp. VKM Ac-2836 TaxID=2739014 RepID=UPI001C27FE71|nr:MarR family transcriptional regulator [Frigoribacterium sp. VKM Ac-2836]